MKTTLKTALVLSFFSLTACDQASEPESRPAGGSTQQTTPAEVETPVAAAELPGEGGLGMPMGKRVGPPDVTPLTVGELRIEAIHWGKERGFQQNGGYIAAIDIATGKEVWTLKVYHIEYDEKMESDVQDIFIETLSKGQDSGTIEIVDERGRRYTVDLRSRSVK